MPLPGTIAITDFGWYSFLARRPTWEEVNFWTPSAHWAFRAPQFSPFLFKLKAPHNAITGFGYFAHYSALPERLAWESFGEANGCATFEEMKARLDAIRQRIRQVETDGAPQIGCIIVVNVTLFPEREWIAQPADWPIRTLRPTRYDLESGEGARVWAECLARAATATGAANRLDVSRYGTPVLVRPRLGQGAFRIAVTDAYGRACAATGEHSLPALEAAHIKPFALDGPHEICNGLLLRADLHRLFDQGYVTVTPERVIEVSSRLRRDYQNGHSYYPLQGQRITVPPSAAEEPSPDLLRWHNEQVFLG